MEKQIPTIEVEIGKGEDLKKVVLYQWLTQEEEDKLNGIMLGDMDIDPSQIKGKETGMKVTLSMAELGESNRFMVESLCKSHTWEEVNIWKPSLRTELLDKIKTIREKN